jgi:metal-responsive CopG/Arc/MetJ family transcriptional regulator
MFLRDASIHFAEATLRGDLDTMEEEMEIEGTAVIYYQHDVENKLTEMRHSDSIIVSSYHHNCLTESHTCVDTMQIRGKAGNIREMVEKLKNTHDVDRVEFVAAPLREVGCC